MANTYDTLGELFTAIANAIRSKKQTSEPIIADDFPEEIETIETDVHLQEKTVSENGEVTPDAGYHGLSKVVVDIPVIEEVMF